MAVPCRRCGVRVILMRRDCPQQPVVAVCPDSVGRDLGQRFALRAEQAGGRLRLTLPDVRLLWVQPHTAAACCERSGALPIVFLARSATIRTGPFCSGLRSGGVPAASGRHAAIELVPKRVPSDGEDRGSLGASLQLLPSARRLESDEAATRDALTAGFFSTGSCRYAAAPRSAVARPGAASACPAPPLRPTRR